MNNFHCWSMIKLPIFWPLQQVFKRSYTQCVVKLEMALFLLFDNYPITKMTVSFYGLTDMVFIQLVGIAHAI